MYAPYISVIEHQTEHVTVYMFTGISEFTEKKHTFTLQLIQHNNNNKKNLIFLYFINTKVMNSLWIHHSSSMSIHSMYV